MGHSLVVARVRKRTKKNAYREGEEKSWPTDRPNDRRTHFACDALNPGQMRQSLCNNHNHNNNNHNNNNNNNNHHHHNNNNNNNDCTQAVGRGDPACELALATTRRTLGCKHVSGTLLSLAGVCVLLLWRVRGCVVPSVERPRRDVNV